MARNYGQMNNYQSQLRECWKCGRKYYEHTMYRVGGKYYCPKHYDKPNPLDKGRR